MGKNNLTSETADNQEPAKTIKIVEQQENENSEIRLDLNTVIGVPEKLLPIAEKTETEGQQMENTGEPVGIEHTEILEQLLTEIHPVNFRSLLAMKPIAHITEKHIVVGVIKSLLQTAQQKKWSLCQFYGYVYVYNGAFWKQCSEGDLKMFLSKAAEKMGLAHQEAKYYEFAGKLLKQFLFGAHFPERRPDENKVLINLRNGTFEFNSEGWKLRDFQQEDFLTYQLPFNYNPQATCPLFQNYLERVLPNETSRMVLQEFTGFIFTKLNLEKCLVLTGSGGNGKSVFFNILNALVGKDNALNYSVGLFNHEYNRAKLTNVLVNYSSEKGFDLNVDTFKALVSGEPLQAREPYGRPFTIYNKVKFIFNCNELPQETEQTEAYFRRFLIVPFNVKITEEEKDISLAGRIINAELPGVFNWLLQGLDRIVAQGDFTESPESNKALEDFRKQSDSTQLFIEEFSYQQSDSKKVFLTDLYAKYKDFCKEDNYKILGKNRFSFRLVKKGFEKLRSKAGFYFLIEEKSDE